MMSNDLFELYIREVLEDCRLSPFVAFIETQRSDELCTDVNFILSYKGRKIHKINFGEERKLRNYMNDIEKDVLIIVREIKYYKNLLTIISGLINCTIWNDYAMYTEFIVHDDSYSKVILLVDKISGFNYHIGLVQGLLYINGKETTVEEIAERFYIEKYNGKELCTHDKLSETKTSKQKINVIMGRHIGGSDNKIRHWKLGVNTNVDNIKKTRYAFVETIKGNKPVEIVGYGYLKDLKKVTKGVIFLTGFDFTNFK